MRLGEQHITTTAEWHARAWGQVEEWARAWDATDHVMRDRFDGSHEIRWCWDF
jgi:hypothetical protein